MPDLLSSLDLVRNRVNRDTVEGKLFQELYMCVSNADKFMRQWESAESNNNVRVNPNADNGTYTFLQYACDQVQDKATF